MTAREKLLDKLRKLRALAADDAGNANEVAAAAARMTELMLEAGVSEAELDATTLSKLRLDFNGKRLTDWKELLLGKLSDIVGCRTLGEEAGPFTTYWIIGPRLQLDGLHYQFLAISGDIQKLQKERWGARANSRDCRDFCLGATRTVIERITVTRERVVQRRTEAGDEKALVYLGQTISDAEAQKVLSPDSPEIPIRPGEVKEFSVDPCAYREGCRAGLDITLRGEHALGAEKVGLAGGA